MKATKRCSLRILFVAAVSFFSYKSAFSQTETHNFKTYDTAISISTGPWSAPDQWNVRISRPINMFVKGNADTASRPAIITMPGQGQLGVNDTTQLTVYGPHYWLNNGWDGSVVLGNGKHYPILITVCYLNDVYPTAPSYYNLLSLLLNTYHIKRSSLYLGGLSQGSFSAGALIEYEQTAGAETGMSIVKAMALFEGTPDPLPAPYSTWSRGNTAFAVWAQKFGGKFFYLEGNGSDNFRNGFLMADTMNIVVPGSAYFSYEDLGGGAHCCWNSMYDPSATNWTSVGTLGPNNAPSQAGVNCMGDYHAPSSVFQWMLRQGDSSLVGSGTPAPPAPVTPPVVIAGSNQTITLPTNSATLNGSASESGGTIASYQWTELSGGTAVITAPGSGSTTVTGLSAGTYVFKLLATDNSGDTASSTLQIVVDAAPAPPPPPPTPPSGGNYISQVVVAEYRTWYIRSDSTIWAFNNAAPTAEEFSIGNGLKTIGGSGGFNYFRMLDTQGYLWTDEPFNVSEATNNATRTNTDSTGAPFSGNWYINAYGDGYMTIRADSSVWYGGVDEFSLFYPGGSLINSTGTSMAPTQLSPAGMKFKKVLFGGNRIVGLTTSGQVYEWLVGGSRTPTLMTTPSPASDIFVSHLDLAGCIIPSPGSVSGMGYPYVWGTTTSMYGGTTAFTEPTSIKSLWNMTVPIKEIAVDWNTIHYIDSLGRMFGTGFNSMGEVGNGQEFVNKYNYPGFPGYGWDFVDYEHPTGLPTQIGIGTSWKHLYSNNWFAFYNYALDVNDSLYSWGRNKGLVLGNGLSNLEEQYSYDALDVLKPTMVHPLQTIYQTYNFTAPSISLGPKQVISLSTANLNAVIVPPLLVKATPIAANGIDTVGYHIVSYQWTLVSGAACTITSPNAVSTGVTGLANGTYIFNLLTTDNNTGTLSANDTIITSVAAGYPIPGKIEAANYNTMFDVATQTTTDTLGGLNVGWIDQGSWMDYKVNVAAAGAYTVNFRIATPNAGAAFQLKAGTGAVLATVNLNSTGGWQDWQTVSATVTLAAGSQTLQLYSTSVAGWNINWMQFAGTTVTASTQTIITSSAGALLSGGTGTMPAFDLYPNPVKDQVLMQINNSYTGNMQVQMIDQSGAILKSYSFPKDQQEFQVTLAVGDLPVGIYFIRAQIGAWSQTKKIIKLQ